MSIETLASMIQAAGIELPSVRSTLANPEPWLREALGASPTAAGEIVTPSNALTYPPVMTCVRILAEIEASLPLHVYRDTDAGKERASGHPSYRILHDEPNPEMSAALFRLYQRQNRALWGNAYALPEWDGAGRLRHLWPLRPDWMSVYRNTAGTKIFEYRPAYGPREGKYLEGEIIHVRGMGDDLVGFSPIRLARESIGLGKAAERFGASFFRNGARMSGVLQVEGRVRDLSQAQKDFDEKYAGASKAGRVLVMDQGSKFVSTSIPPDDAQFLETRSFQRSDLYGIYGVPPHMAGDTEKSTSWGTGIEQQFIGFVVLTVAPSTTLAEQEYNRKLLGGGLYCKHSLSGLMRGDAKSRAEFYAVMVMHGIMTRDEVRELEDLNRRGGAADVLTAQSQNVPLDQMGQQQNQPAQ
jgi:HK97 family phage portal protein